ncbi:MAG: protein kinase [Pseudomonadota bacterium]
MTKPEPRHKGKTALVVDDDGVVRVLIARMMAKLGFSVREAADGVQALQAVEKQDFDIVITDLAMPRMDGIEFIRRARECGLSSPVIFLSGTESVSKAVEAMKVGATEFLEKPMNSYRLAEAVDQLMAAAGAEKPRACKAGQPPADETAFADPSVQVEVGMPETVKLDSRQDPTTPMGPGRTGPAPPKVRLPKKIGRYEVLQLIGKGGMGLVYACSDPLLGRSVAVKVLSTVSDKPQEAQELVTRFQREANAAATLSHPNIVAIHDMGQDEEGDWFIVMELLQGAGLHQFLDREGKLPESEAVSLGFQVADALAFAHGRGVIHRDVKPSNMIVQPDGTAMLLDFGLAAVRGWHLTLSGRILGSPAYMAPERIRGEQGGAAADQFSLGVVLYECMTGENPFDGDTVETRFLRVLEYDPPPLCEACDAVGQQLSNAIARMMCKQEHDRFQDMGSVADAFALLGRSMDMELKRHIPK